MSSANPILDVNLSALARSEPRLAETLRDTAPAALHWQASKAGPLTARLDLHGASVWLASQYEPLVEAGKLVAHVDFQKHACVVVLGLGLGYHVADLARRATEATVLMVFEPDLSLLRAVLERIDHSAWLCRHNLIIAHDSADRAALTARVEPLASVVTQGMVLVTHPPTRQRHPAQVNAFSELVTQVLSFCRTHVATALVNSARTVRNLCGNLAYYAGGATTDDLLNCAQGYPALCVGAGPSLARNIDQLRDPQVRRNVIVISAQTTLRPLLDRGIEPDFVTALDYSEISRRFYEGLPAELPRTTLVAEPLAHPSVLDSFPGPKRLTQSRILDMLLGERARPRVPVPYGATVAHLSFYLAQHLGCDPIILIGQDLGFSDGLYYCPGTAIHDVWAPELSTFNTLEMMEWQRIVRHRNHLEKFQDVNGAPIYSDEQMLTYLKQFERDFAAAKQKVIDATEGGLAKAHTVRMPLAEALSTYATRPLPGVPMPPSELQALAVSEAAGLLDRRVAEVQDLRRCTGRTIPILRKMQQHLRDPQRLNKLFDELQQIQRKVDGELGQAFQLVNELNTVGAFRRARADRAIAHGEADPIERQRQRLQRDLDNLDWLLQACDEALNIFRGGLTRLEQQQTSRSAA